MIHLMMRTESSKDNVTETSSLLKQELDNTSKLRLKRTKKRRLQHARKFLKNSSCLEDTSLDSNQVFGRASALSLILHFIPTSHKIFPRYITFNFIFILYPFMLKRSKNDTKRQSNLFRLRP